MAELNVMQPNSLNSSLKSLSAGSPIGTSVSDEVSRIDQSNVTQEIEKTKNDLKQLKSEETNGQTEQVQLDSLMKDLNLQLENLQNYLRFERDDSSEKMVIFIKNSETDEVIRQIPSQEFMTISKNITNYLEMRQQLSETVVTPPGLITHEKA
ncbi:MAG: flagellar protein FlaG [Thiotrichales bacterium]|nr:flagellar protein FlaG [Thiotrichales bacterium]